MGLREAMDSWREHSEETGHEDCRATNDPAGWVCEESGCTAVWPKEEGK